MATDIYSLVPRPTPFFVLQFAFSIIHGGVFYTLPLSCIILKKNQRTKNRVGLRMRLQISYGHAKAATDAWLLIRVLRKLLRRSSQKTNHCQISESMEIEDIVLYSI